MRLAYRLLAVPAVLLVIGALSPAFAIGIGGGLAVDGGGTDWEVDFENGPELDADSKNGRLGCFFVLDTAPQGEGLFHYRLSTGWERFEGDFEFDEGLLNGVEDDLQLTGLFFDSDLGFRVYANRNVRLWVGPRARIAFYGGEFEDSNDDVGLIELGIGPVFGANLAIDPRFTIGGVIGVRLSAYTGEIDDGPFEHDLRGGGGSFFLNGVFIWSRR